MSENTVGNNIYQRISNLVIEFEQSRDGELTEIGRQFTQLQKSMVKCHDIPSCSEGAKSSNRLKNRYKDILPYDKCRVILQSQNGSDYINASFIQDFYGQNRYIAAQGPITESLVDFFRMIWDFQIKSIICTANDVEAGRFKFCRYWPDDETSLQFGCYHIAKDENSDKCFYSDDYEIRPFVLTDGNVQRQIILYRFLHWLDHDIPNDESPILDLLLKLYQDRNSVIDSPILVHCSAGCGRTGTIIAIDLCRLLIKDETLFLSKDFQPYPVLKVAIHIRQYRVALIQTLKQYVFVYKMFLFMMIANGSTMLNSIENYDEYETFLTPNTKSSSSRRPSGTLSIKLRNPPVGRRLLNGSTMSNTPSPTVSPSEFFSQSSKSSSLNDTPVTPEPSTDSRHDSQYVNSNKISIKTNFNFDRSKNEKQRSFILKEERRANSADIRLNSNLRRHQHRSYNERATYSD